MKVSKRHIVKSISWRIIGSVDTFLISWLITGDLLSGLKISSYELITKMILYYAHERVWFNSKIKNANKRHLIKTFTWRFIGTIDTIILAAFISGNPLFGIKIGGVETLTKIILYYLHEKLWYKLNFGLINSRK